MESVFCKRINSAEEGMVLYTLENQIIFQIIPCHGTREYITPYLLEDDFLSNLCICHNDHDIWYAYQDIQNNIVVKSLSDKQIMLKLQQTGTLVYSNFNLCLLDNKPALTYCVFNKANDNFQLCMQTQPSWQITIIHDSFDISSDYKLYPDQDGILLITSKKNESDIYWIDNLQITHKIPSLADIQMLQNQFTELQDSQEKTSVENKKYQEMLEQVCKESDEYQKMLEQVRKENEEYQKMRKQVDKQKEEYQALISKKDTEIKKLNILLERAKKQYNDLADTAMKYRNEAIKWRNLCDF